MSDRVQVEGVGWLYGIFLMLVFISMGMMGRGCSENDRHRETRRELERAADALERIARQAEAK